MATINGTSGNDSLNGTSGNDTLNGLGGNDTLAGSAGTDRYDGGTGSDTLDLRLTSTGVTVNFVDGTISGGFTGTFVNMERVLGGNGADNLTGTAGSQNLSARGGNDTLAGGAGVDTLWGGSGADSFTYRETGTANADSIADFASGADKIVLNTVVMGTLGTSGNFAAGDERFVANSSGTAQEADDRVIYETDTRQIWYDPDGTGIAARELIATLQSGATLVATDIVVQGQGSGGGGPTPIVGTEGNDSLTGTDGNDTIDGRGGNDFLDGRLGSDELIGGEGNDTLDASSFFERNDAPDTLIGGLGDDRYNVDNPADVTSDAGGVDTVHVFELSWTLADGFENLMVEGDLTVTGIGNDLDNLMKLSRGGRLEGRGGDDTLVSSDIGGELFGEDGNDSLVGDFQSDTLDGGAGNDTFRGATSNDTLSGGAGADVFVLDSRGHWDDGFENPSFDTILDFSSGVDRIVLDGRVMPHVGASGTLASGDPRFYAAPGATEGHDADDRLVYDTATGRLYYDEDGNGPVEAEVALVLNSGAGAAGLAATDITIENGSVVTTGTAGDDSLVGSTGHDLLSGLAGNDTLVGLEGRDTLDGGAGNDSLVGGPEGNMLHGGEGDDFLDTGGEFGHAWGDAGADRFYVTLQSGTPSHGSYFFRDFATGTDQLVFDASTMPALGASGTFVANDERFAANSTGTAQDASDRIIYNTSNGVVSYDADGSGPGAALGLVGLGLDGVPSVAATDIVVINGTAPSGNVINGTSGNDTLTGTAGNDFINGLGGNDLFLAGSTGGADTIDGGAGRDSIEFKDRATSPITVDFATGSITGGSSGTISFAGIERIVATNFNDSLTGDAAAQTLTGQSGADTIAGAGAADTLWGGSGGDNFLFREMGTANADRISDFASGSDNVWLDDVVFTTIGEGGRFGPQDDRFKANSSGTATDPSDRVVFNTSTGQLYYDADGNGGGAAQLIATVQSGASIVASDIVVF